MTETRLPILYTVEEVADILHIGRSTVFQLIRQERIESIRLGRSRRIPIDSIQKYVNELIGQSQEKQSPSLSSEAA